MEAKVDGEKWEASLMVVATHDDNILTVTGSDASSQQLQVIIENYSSPGTYEIGGTSDNDGRWTAGLGQNDTYMTLMGQGSGEVVITDISKDKVQGTFHFTAQNGNGEEVAITDAEFDAEIQN